MAEIFDWEKELKKPSLPREIEDRIDRFVEDHEATEAIVRNICWRLYDNFHAAGLDAPETSRITPEELFVLWRHVKEDVAQLYKALRDS